MHRGYIKLWRKGLEHGLFKKPLVWHFWCYCLMRANHKDAETEFNGRPFFLKRGSFIMSLRNAAADTGLSIQNIRTALKILENFKMLEKSTRKLTQQATVINICKYSQYQKKDDEPNTENNTELTQRQHSANTALTLDNNVKNEKKVKNVKKDIPPKKSAAFERWWKSYPTRNGRRVGKEKSRKLFYKVPVESWNDLKTATVNYAAECDPTYIRDPERFLRNDYWKEYVEARDQGKPRNGEQRENEEPTFVDIWKEMESKLNKNPDQPAINYEN